MNNIRHTSHGKGVHGMPGTEGGTVAGAPLGDAAKMLLYHVTETLDALPKEDQDAAVRELARKYADVIDRSDGHCRACDDPDCRRSTTSAWTMRWIGPLLLECLAELGATPAARSRLKKGKPDAPKAGRLQALRDARQA